ncbi:MAG: bifunctional pyr operon transcriptional regulator/uracil phosphoribosyltransferase PyrR [Proteobacteria bacterium]|nr:bifunctional pyr operon transcriptional regulator/uracil phosphoribosyltransferase PyrR [Pseudomonadota bacterium]MBU1582397.1 bifunctional pyr operon transcriptional regulator/uracil phosphoribosyltransferase PyrR [Pseudomonadota bacterium]MBU2452181.1 bifunctional pyr operon transcriptional regulator/uracil phosphoribosyltransferase PyrR [Pseudomonadota bacterium]MBU2630378.1 bifunctional pyr operon transcriptional regulator/uracil phosphoribosyltransferase PyrR [Pseudomonadota bacterium]
MKKKKTILNDQDFKRIITRMSHEIIEKHKGTRNLALVGIQTRGDFLAKRLADQIRKIENVTLPVGSMDINMYRDDWTKISHQPIVRPSNIPFSVDEMDIILVDDVLFTGRTIRAAMDALMDFGRPSRIELAILVDRGHRELPIQADYNGILINTEHQDMVNVLVAEHDQQDKVYIEQD